MLESIPKEIIGIAYASEWDNIKQFIKALLSMTLDSEESYSLIALNAIINKKRYEEYENQIKSKAQIKLLSTIKDFEKITLYQYSEYKRNIINVSKDKDVIVLTAQYMGPEIDHSNYFDFAIYLDSFNLPYFSDNKGNIFDCRDMMEIIRKFKPKIPKIVKKPEIAKKLKTFNLEVKFYESITNKNAFWRESETKAFQKWKLKGLKEFRDKTGGLPYYKGKVTKKYELYLNSLTMKSVPKKSPPKKPSPKKPRPKKIPPKKPSPKKPRPKKIPPKKPSPKKPRPKKIPPKKSPSKKPRIKKSPVKKPITKSPVDRKKTPIKNITPLDMESEFYKKLTGKNAIYGGKITKAFGNWKLQTHKKFQQKVRGKPYYKGALTQKYKKYLSSLKKS